MMNKSIISLLIILQIGVINQDNPRNYDIKINNTLNDKTSKKGGTYHIKNNDNLMRRMEIKSAITHIYIEM